MYTYVGGESSMMRSADANHSSVAKRIRAPAALEAALSHSLKGLGGATLRAGSVCTKSATLVMEAT